MDRTASYHWFLPLRRGTNNGALALSLFPKINMLRVNCEHHPGLAQYSGNDDPAEFQSFVAAMIKAQVVIEFEYHDIGRVRSGPALISEVAWYQKIATMFTGNPYVWFGTVNEPNSGNLRSIAAEQRAVYDAIRGTGNDNLILLEMRGGFTNEFAQQNALIYASMTNVIWDVHFYGWIPGYSTDQPTVNRYLAAEIHAGSVTLPAGWNMVGAQSVVSADGLVPVIIGEYGDSSNGAIRDPNANQVLAAVHTGKYGSIAWTWHEGNADLLIEGSQPTLTSYGQAVAQYIGSGS